MCESEAQINTTRSDRCSPEKKAFVISALSRAGECAASQNVHSSRRCRRPELFLQVRTRVLDIGSYYLTWGGSWSKHGKSLVFLTRNGYRAVFSKSSGLMCAESTRTYPKLSDRRPQILETLACGTSNDWVASQGDGRRQWGLSTSLDYAPRGGALAQ